MGKNKRQKLSSSHRAQKFKGVDKSGKTQPLRSNPPHVQAQHAAPTIPFSPCDRILLIGEGDFSFARSLVEHHECVNITATVLESSPQALEVKYPHAGENIAVIEAAGGVVKHGVDATKMAAWTDRKCKGAVGVMDRIFFNFPHVGGKSTDVNRQVRYNQELLVSFFKTSLLSLSPALGSSIIVTLFEGEPYTLWNIRDLARHSGLQVEKSFKFQAKAYPGYKHSRTLGIIKGKNGEVGSGWKGEERAARSYVFVRKGESEITDVGKRKRDRSDDEEEDDN